MEDAAQVLDSFEIGYEADVVSAHRMPHQMIEYGTAGARPGAAGDHRRCRGRRPPARDARVGDPAAGHRRPGAAAHLDGMDSLLSIVQMPAGVPVATVSVAGARNAGLLAVRILAAGDDDEAQRLREAMVEFQHGPAGRGEAKGERLRGRRAGRLGAVGSGNDVAPPHSAMRSRRPASGTSPSAAAFACSSATVRSRPCRRGFIA